MMLPFPDFREPAALDLLPLPPSGGMVARVKRGLLDAPRAVSGLPGSAVRMSIKLRASVAEFLFISHLRARSQPARSRDQSPEVIQRGAEIILETAVGCARVCRERRAWQGETKQRTLVRNEEQRSQGRRARCNRVHSAVT